MSSTSGVDGPLRVVVEVTNTVRSARTTGLQRVAVALVTALDARSDVDVAPVVHDPILGALRPASETDLELLAAHLETPATGSRGGAAGGRFGLERIRQDATWATRIERLRGHLPGVVTRALAREVIHWGDVDVFCDLEASWHDPLPRSGLLPHLSGLGVRCAAMVADIYPLRHPEWFTDETVARFRSWLEAQVSLADHLFCISEATRADLETWCTEQDLAAPSMSVLHLGYGHRCPEPSTTGTPVGTSGPWPLPAGERYLLVVGTVEPRKNIGLALDVHARLRVDHPDLRLVVVGKPGWERDEILRRLRSSPGVLWLDDVDDGGLCHLYRQALVLLAPSLGEGFGLPVQEALAHGCPVLASDAGAQAEAARGAAELFAVDDAEAVEALLRRHLDDAAHHAAVRSRVATFRAPTWADTADELVAGLK